MGLPSQASPWRLQPLYAPLGLEGKLSQLSGPQAAVHCAEVPENALGGARADVTLTTAPHKAKKNLRQNYDRKSSDDAATSNPTLLGG